jgi:hypothetical protein
MIHHQHLSPERAKTAFEQLFSSKKIAAMRGETLTARGVGWAELIDVNIEMIKRHLSLVLERRSSNKQLKASELIEVRCAIDAALRRASTRPSQYAAPLYFSDLIARKALDIAGDKSTIRRVAEHAVPLAALLSGAKLLADPDHSLEKLSRVVIAPICVIDKSEDPKNRKSHPDIEKPFLRYADAGIIVYTASDFTPVNPETFTWRDHISEMSKFALYASAIDRTNNASV